MQKATIVGQLSNLIAHELAQPLAAVQYYLDGMKTLLSRQPVNTAMLEKSRIGIEQGLERTKAIVAKVRGYSRNQTRRDRTVSLKTTIDNVLTAISPDLQRSVAFKCESVEGIDVLGDALELELLMRNLIKNLLKPPLPRQVTTLRALKRFRPYPCVPSPIRQTKRIVLCSSPSRTQVCR